MTPNTVAGSERLQRLIAFHRSDPHNVSLYRDCVATALQCGEFDVAVSLAEAQLQRGTDEPMARFDLASGLIGRRDYSEALLQLQRLPSGAQQQSAVLLNRGLCHFCLQQYEQARAPLDACYAQGERGAGLLRLLLGTLHHLGLLTSAIPIAAEAADAAATDAGLAGALAVLYLDAGDLPKARQWARTALQLHPKSVEGRVVQATLLTARLQKERARTLLEEVLTEIPETGRAWLGLGTLALIEQDMAQAKRHLQRGLELMPQHVGSWHVLGWAHMMSGELPQAQAAFDRALALDRNFAETHGGLAAVAALRGERSQARALLEVARRLDSECLSATFAEAMLQAQSGDPAQAQQLVLARVAELASSDSSALAQLLAQVSRGRPQ